VYKKKIEKRNKITALIISLILLFIFSFKFNNLTTEGTKVDNNKLRISALTFPIFIDDTAPGSNWAWAAVQPWFGGGSGTSGDPYILEDLIIDGLSAFDCITIQNSKKDFIIRNCTVYNGDGAIASGIVLKNVTNGQILENNCTMNDLFNIYFEDCKNIIISDNSVSLNLNPAPGIIGYDSNYTIISHNMVFDCGFGIYLDNCLNNDILDNVVHDTTVGYGIDLEDSPYNKIEGNEIRRCEGGIEMDDKSGPSNANNNTVVGNTVEDNENSGIWLQGNLTYISGNTLRNNSEHGIYLYQFSYHNIITNNILDNNSLSGIYLFNSSDNQILHNEISDNEYGAIVSPDADDNLFSENFFLKNKKHAYDYGANNDWNSLTIGNYWDNYTGTDANYDGIGDTPHNITGDSGSKDYLPIWDDGVPLINITSPLNNSNIGSDAPDFLLEITEPNLDTIWYTIDGGINNITSTANGTIDQTSWETLWDSLAKGDNITIMFYANDTYGHLGSNFIVLIKHVPEDIIGLDFFATSMLVLITSGIAIIAIISKIHSKKRIISH